MNDNERSLTSYKPFLYVDEQVLIVSTMWFLAAAALLLGSIGVLLGWTGVMEVRNDYVYLAILVVLLDLPLVSWQYSNKTRILWIFALVYFLAASVMDYYHGGTFHLYLYAESRFRLALFIESFLFLGLGALVMFLEAIERQDRQYAQQQTHFKVQQKEVITIEPGEIPPVHWLLQQAESDTSACTLPTDMMFRPVPMTGEGEPVNNFLLRRQQLVAILEELQLLVWRIEEDGSAPERLGLTPEFLEWTRSLMYVSTWSQVMLVKNVLEKADSTHKALQKAARIELRKHYLQLFTSAQPWATSIDESFMEILTLSVEYGRDPEYYLPVLEARWQAVLAELSENDHAIQAPVEDETQVSIVPAITELQKTEDLTNYVEWMQRGWEVGDFDLEGLSIRDLVELCAILPWDPHSKFAYALATTLYEKRLSAGDFDNPDEGIVYLYDLDEPTQLEPEIVFALTKGWHVPDPWLVQLVQRLFAERFMYLLSAGMLEAELHGPQAIVDLPSDLWPENADPNPSIEVVNLGLQEQDESQVRYLLTACNTIADSGAEYLDNDGEPFDWSTTVDDSLLDGDITTAELTQPAISVEETEADSSTESSEEEPDEADLFQQELAFSRKSREELGLPPEDRFTTVEDADSSSEESSEEVDQDNSDEGDDDDSGDDDGDWQALLAAANDDGDDDPLSAFADAWQKAQDDVNGGNDDA